MSNMLPPPEVIFPWTFDARALDLSEFGEKDDFDAYVIRHQRDPVELEIRYKKLDAVERWTLMRDDNGKQVPHELSYRRSRLNDWGHDKCISGC